MEFIIIDAQALKIMTKIKLPKIELIVLTDLDINYNNFDNLLKSYCYKIKF